jgi:hypothetical protein
MQGSGQLGKGRGQGRKSAKLDCMAKLTSGDQLFGANLAEQMV